MDGQRSCMRGMWFVGFLCISISTGSYAADIIPPGVLTYPLTSAQHPLADNINTFLQNQTPYSGDFAPTGLNHQDYLEVIESLVRAMMKYQNSSGQIVDPVRGREFQYATPCFAHGVSVLVGSGYVNDNAVLQAGIKAMDAGIKHMVDGTVPDRHFDFCTVPLMLGLQNYRTVVDAATITRWRNDLDKIEPSIYRNGANNSGTNPNWGAINGAGEYLRYLEGLTDLAYVENKVSFNLTRMSTLGLYQDQNGTLETGSVSNINGNSFAYENVARSMLTLVADNDYSGEDSENLKTQIWKGAWTGLFYQSPFGEVPAGFRSAHHIWNEAAAAINYEIWAKQYAQAGHSAEAGAFKRAAMLSLQCVQSWLHSDGSAFVTKARYPIEAQWGYMSYSSHTQYNMWCASFLSTAWQFGDSTIQEMPSPADIGGFAIPVLLGFKKVFANTGGTYVEYDVRGDHCHNPTGLIRAHLKSSYPQLGPSDGAIGEVIGGAYPPQYNQTDPSGLQNLSIGPAWQNSSDEWYPLAELQQIPQVTILQEEPLKSRFKLVYTISDNTELHETVAIDPNGITVNDTIEGGSASSMRVYYPILVTDGEDQSSVALNGNQVTVGLKNKGVRFSILNPDTITFQRVNKERNHRNGRCDAVYAEIPGRTVEYVLTAWPILDPTSNGPEQRIENVAGPANGSWLNSRVFQLPSHLRGAYTVAIYSLQGKRITEFSGCSPDGIIDFNIRDVPRAHGIYRTIIACQGLLLYNTLLRM